MTPEDALALAVEAARQSRCRKSQRGVVVWCKGDPRGTVWHHVGAWNYRADLGRHGPLCDGSEACRAACGKVCIHAEADALHLATVAMGLLPWECQMLHVKVIDGEAVPSGAPSCWQCSRMLLMAGIQQMWLLHEEGLRGYTAEEFHRITLQTCGLPLPALETS